MGRQRGEGSGKSRANWRNSEGVGGEAKSGVTSRGIVVQGRELGRRDEVGQKVIMGRG